MTNPLAVAITAKGSKGLLTRANKIIQRYGHNSSRMNLALQKYCEILKQYQSSATFPITAITLNRHGNIVKKYLEQDIELAVHGYTHINYASLSADEQVDHLHLARQVFEQNGILPSGFRSPYLSHNSSLNTAIMNAGFSYVSNQSILWDSLDKYIQDPRTITNYERAIAFYNPWHASNQPSLPRLEGNLVEIPISLPDDEILIERLASTNDIIKKAWLQILSRSYQRGELFTLQLHPERIGLCADGLSSVLSEARSLIPAVWIARLDEIAAWWKNRTQASVQFTGRGDGNYDCLVTAPAGTTILARNVKVNAPTQPWDNGYNQVKSMHFTLFSPVRPIISVSPTSSPKINARLQELGYIIETSTERQRYSYHIDQGEFLPEQEGSLVSQIEETNLPLVKLGRWPYAARSALSITGDIDALTLWDYGLRLIGK